MTIVPFSPPPGFDFDKLPWPRPPFRGTREEQDRFVKAVQASFPECSKDAIAKNPPYQHPTACHYHTEAWTGRVYEFHMCDGHSFATEQDAHCSRLDRMLFVYRTRDKFMADEGLLRCCPECRTVYLGATHDCVERPVPNKEDFPW